MGKRRPEVVLGWERRQVGLGESRPPGPKEDDVPLPERHQVVQMAAPDGAEAGDEKLHGRPRAILEARYSPVRRPALPSV